MAKITFEEYQDLKAKGLMDKEIAEQKGMPASNLSLFKRKWFGQTETDSVKPKQPIVSNNTTKDKTSEYEKLIKSLKNKLEDATTTIESKEQQIKRMQETIEKYKHVNDACDDVEMELVQVRDKADKLTVENQAMRQLLKLWI